MMKKRILNTGLFIALFLFAGLVIFLACKQTNQPFLAMSLQLKFVGEYSQNGGNWQTLEEDTDLSAFDGDLALRGRFDPELPEGVSVYFYLDHIGMSVSVNGENPYEVSNEIYPDVCGTGWQEWILPAMSENDVIEIQLHNPHSYGNKEAYRELLDSIYMSGATQLKQHYEKEEMPYRYFCIFLFVVSIALIGTAIGYLLLHLPNSALLLKMGFMSLLMAVYMNFDTKDIFLRNDQMVFNTYMRQVAMMLAALLLTAGTMELLHEKRRKIAQIAGYVLMLANFMFMAIPLAGVMGIYDTGIYWAAIQGFVSLILTILCIMEIKNSTKQQRIMLLCGVVLLTVLIAELMNGRMSLWKNGACIKAVFGVLFVFLLMWGIRQVAVNYQASIRAKKLEKELKENQMSLAMSQIQPHFIYNSLNSIYHLCEKDVEMAQQAIGDFSDYLQQSLRVVDRTTLISFEEELKHVKTYLKLEQLRFGEDLHVVYHIGCTDFMLPALSVQPLVENAVKHGICQKEEGSGTVILTVKECPDCYEVIVSDDGVGFVPGIEANGEGSHVGIRNVRQRLDIMCHATLEVQSEPGKGTTSRIRIPKEADA
ncbi:MAG: histidine kinase [Lachnospiraceae bacterium]|nr:histidine kinase [bacterium]MDY5517692.1 histidine kinase [Lachnospiraceae bacterium]